MHEHTGQTLADAGEYAFIARIRESMPPDGGPVVRSVGDDCLATEPFSPGELVLHTIDTFVDTVHFDRRFASWRDIGARCMNASVSDIAAMAGIPAWTLVSLSLPAGMAFDDAVALFDGLREIAERHGCPIAGGETTATPGPATITVTVYGRVERNRMTTRSGAQPGDRLYLTGRPGEAMAGLESFMRGDDGFPGLRERFTAPEARIAAARALTEACGVSAMIDLSDGLSTDLANLCRESRCGAVIEEAGLPFGPEYRTFCARHGLDPVSFALAAGEDYELLFTVRGAAPERFEVAGVTATHIGTITPASDGIVLRRPTGNEPIAPRGYEHFRT